MRIKKSKKGELTTQQIVILVILITSFAIILVLLFRLNLGKTTDKEICHNSVVMKGSSALTRETSSLNCHTGYICLSEDGTCEQMTNPDIKKVKTENEAYQVLADEMVDCWWMFGEGKINYVEKKLLSNLYCSICSQIAFDDSLKKIFPDNEINKTYFYENYIAKKKISGKEITYLEYLYGTNTLSESSSIDFGKINFDNQYYILMGVTNEISKLQWAGIGGAVGVVAATFIPGGIVIGAIIVGASAITGGTAVPSLISLYVKGESGKEYLSPTIIKVDSEEFKSLNCKSIKTLA